MNMNSLSPELEAVWDLAEKANPLQAMAAPDPVRVRAIRNRLAAQSRPLRYVQTRHYWAIAASIALLIVSGLFFYSRPIQVTTADESVEIVLPDESAVTVLPNSSLTYHRRFGRSHRQIALEGSAFFDVHAGTTPFVVLTPDLSVTVEGTRFSVDADSEGSAVFVTEGVVAVTVQGQTLRASAGEGVRIDKITGHFSTTSSMAGGAEAAEMFIHIKQPLGVMFDAAEERFDIEIIAEDHIRQHVHNFKHEITTSEALVSDLCRSVTSMVLRYRETATGFEVLEER